MQNGHVLFLGIKGTFLGTIIEHNFDYVPNQPKVRLIAAGNPFVIFVKTEDFH